MLAVNLEDAVRAHHPVLDEGGVVRGADRLAIALGREVAKQRVRHLKVAVGIELVNENEGDGSTKLKLEEQPHERASSTGAAFGKGNHPHAVVEEEPLDAVSSLKNNKITINSKAVEKGLEAADTIVLYDALDVVIKACQLEGPAIQADKVHPRHKAAEVRKRAKLCGRRIRAQEGRKA